MLSSKRQALQREMAWWLGHTTDIHYAQIRPMPLASAKGHHLPITTDCSGAVTCIAFAAGCPDPNQLGYNGQGFTGTLFANGEPIGFSDLEVGDYIVVGRGDASVHVYMVYDRLSGGDWDLFSHGRESAPERVKLSSAIAEHGRGNLYPRRFVAPSEQKPDYVWVIHNGAGEVLARTEHPVRFALRHPKTFRKFTHVNYHRLEK